MVPDIDTPSINGIVNETLSMNIGDRMYLDMKFLK